MKTLKNWRIELGARLKTGALKLNYIFAFTKRDRRIMVLLTGILGCVIVLRAWAVIRPAKEWIILPQQREMLSDLTAPGTGKSPRTAYNVSDSARKSVYTPPAYLQKKKFTVDLNLADTFDLQEIRGIGSGFARRIMQHREKLGGFSCVEQLREVWGIDSVLYARILPFVYVREPVYRKMNLNEVDIKTLRNHPYLDYYQAKEIYMFRQKNGPYKRVDELQTLTLIDDDTYRRLKPYLTVEKGGTE